MGTLTNKVAVVTGASRGIGAAAAKRLAAEGAKVAITYSTSPDKAREVVAEIEKAGGAAIALQADSGDSKAVRDAIAKVAAHFGGTIDILVNNAGILTFGEIGTLAEADLDRAIDVNARGMFAATQEALRYMGAGGRIIMIGSVNSDYIPFPGASVYTLTKGAVAGFTRGLARDLGSRGITVNNIQPGPVETDMNPATGAFADVMLPKMAVGRYGKTDEVAGLVAYLAGPEAGYITGAQIKIDGGFAA